MFVYEPQFQYFSPFLNVPYYQTLENYVLSNDVKWDWMDRTISEDHENYKEDSFVLGHSVFHDTQQEKLSEVSEVWQPLIKSIENQFVCRIHRIRLNLYTNQNQKIYTVSHHDVGEKGINVPDRKANIIILNFTNCNGGTKIGNVEIVSRRNGAVFFNNVHKHCGILHTDAPRRVCANIVTFPQETSNSDSIA